MHTVELNAQLNQPLRCNHSTKDGFQGIALYERQEAEQNVLHNAIYAT